LPADVHVPDRKELDRNSWTKVGRLIDERVLLKHACCDLPCQENAVVEAVSKAQIPPPYAKALGVETKPAVAPFTPLEEVEKALERMVRGVDLSKMAEEAAKERVGRLQGRV
jgi:hypothetical protein